jgi:hypothetical protein
MGNKAGVHPPEAGGASWEGSREGLLATEGGVVGWEGGSAARGLGVTVTVVWDLLEAGSELMPEQLRRSSARRASLCCSASAALCWACALLMPFGLLTPVG